jgi:hypothetical protein
MPVSKHRRNKKKNLVRLPTPTRPYAAPLRTPDRSFVAFRTPGPRVRIVDEPDAGAVGPLTVRVAVPEDQRTYAPLMEAFIRATEDGRRFLAEDGTEEVLKAFRFFIDHGLVELTYVPDGDGMVLITLWPLMPEEERQRA